MWVMRQKVVARPRELSFKSYLESGHRRPIHSFEDISRRRKNRNFVSTQTCWGTHSFGYWLDILDSNCVPVCVSSNYILYILFTEKIVTFSRFLVAHYYIAIWNWLRWISDDTSVSEHIAPNLRWPLKRVRERGEHSSDSWLQLAHVIIILWWPIASPLLFRQDSALRGFHPETVTQKRMKIYHRREIPSKGREIHVLSTHQLMKQITLVPL